MGTVCSEQWTLDLFFHPSHYIKKLLNDDEITVPGLWPTSERPVFLEEWLKDCRNFLPSFDFFIPLFGEVVDVLTVIVEKIA